MRTGNRISPSQINRLHVSPVTRIGFLREKHELEGRIANLQDMLEASAEQVNSRPPDLLTS